MTKRHMVLGVLVLACLLVAVAAAVVGSTGPPGRQGDGQAVGSTTSTSEQTRRPEPSTTTSGTSSRVVSPGRCPPGGPPPRGQVALNAADLDGDGAGDTVYLLNAGDEDAPALGVALATGHSSETAFDVVIASSASVPST